MLPWRKRRREIKEFDDLIEASSLGSPAARQIRSLTTDEDMERFRKQLARKNDRKYRWPIVGGILFLLLIHGLLGVLDVIDDQFLHAALSGLSIGILCIAIVMAVRLPKGNFAPIHLTVALSLIFESIRLSLRGSWWSVAAMLVAAIFMLHGYQKSRTLDKRK